MIAAVEMEGASHLDLRVALHLQIALEVGRGEGDFRIFLALKNVFVHFRIAPAVSTFAAGGVDHNEAIEFSCRRIESYVTAF